MKDKEFLQWIHDRLEFNHAENKDVDYMHKLRAIIKDYPEEKITHNVCSFSPEVDTGWISVSEVLPEGIVLVTDGDIVRTSYLCRNYCGTGEDVWGKTDPQLKEHNITHWMSLPEPPK